jgi:predicted DCC family thiol-disulfide oxidoreductase YuxK
LLHMRLCFGDWFGQNSTYVCFLVRHTPQPHLYLKEGGQHFAHIPTTHHVATHQQASDGLDAGAKATRRPARGWFACRLMTAVQARKRMHLVFNDFRDDWGQFANLVTLRAGILAQQQRPTPLTTNRLADHKSIDFIRWFQTTATANMSWLTPLLTFALLFGRRRGHIRWVTGRWLGRITRVSTHLFFQLLDTTLQLPYGLLQFIHSPRQRVDQALHTGGRSIPILG